MEYPISSINPRPADETVAASPADRPSLGGGPPSGLTPAPQTLDAAMRIDRFAILRPLGQGGMGDVFLARHPVTGSEVAVKRLKQHLIQDADAVRRFIAEAKHMYHLNHPRILRVMEVGESPTGPYFVMPFMGRGSLWSVLRDGKPAEAAFTLRVARDIAEALAHAHGKGMIHRDLKPANVLLDNEGHAALSDFGLVRQFTTNDEVYDGPETFCEGTAPYMSPAVARGEIEDTRCDIYGFGAMLYELLTGHLPYVYDGAQSMRQTLAHILQGPPPKIHTRNPKAPAGLAAIADGCMARELRDRYAKMSDVVADLERVAAGKEPLGPHHAWRIPRRLKIVITVGFCLAMLVGAGIWLKPMLYRPKPIDLMPTIKFDGHTVVGAVRQAPDGTFELNPGGSDGRALILIPYEPKGAYDLIVTFTRTSGDNGLDHCLVYKGHRFVWTLAGFNNSASGFWRVGGSDLSETGGNAGVARDNWIEDNRVYKSEVRVRGRSISAYLDDEHVYTHSTDYSDIGGDNIMTDPMDRRLALSALKSGFKIHSIRVVPREASDPP